MIIDMVVGVGIIELWLGDCMSLKEKRSLLSRLLSRTRREFNITLAEVGANDEWRRAIIGFSTVGNDRRHINGRIDCVVGFIEGLNLAEIAASRFEILNFNTESISSGYGEDKYDEL
ncbi:MAG: DUF503 domain-containing protein [Smithellaceae bacterium]|nr:DUF503 domain-containing protein [Smithellaceae bacterium]